MSNLYIAQYLPSKFGEPGGIMSNYPAIPNDEQTQWLPDKSHPDAWSVTLPAAALKAVCQVKPYNRSGFPFLSTMIDPYPGQQVCWEDGVGWYLYSELKPKFEELWASRDGDGHIEVWGNNQPKWYTNSKSPKFYLEWSRYETNSILIDEPHQILNLLPGMLAKVRKVQNTMCEYYNTKDKYRYEIIGIVECHWPDLMQNCNLHCMFRKWNPQKTLFCPYFCYKEA